MAQARRKVLSLHVCACCHEAGFSSAEESAIELLTVMLQTLMIEIGRSSQLLAEHNGRSEVTPSDLIIALIEMGINVNSVLEFAEEKNLILGVPVPSREQPHRQPTILHIGRTLQKHLYIPEYFPDFPDSHSYIRTPTRRRPITEYEVIRDKAASQKRDLERALTRFMAKTCNPNPEHTLFGRNVSLNNFLPLISMEPSLPPFLNALIPKDQIFEDEIVTSTEPAKNKV